MRKLKSYTEANRLAWNEATRKHQSVNRDKWEQRFSVFGYSVFEDPELAQLKKIEVEGKTICHLCCNNGVELMSFKNLGAKKCVGFDISDDAINEASQRSLKTGVACEFVRADVYEIDLAYNGIFDVVYISIGCFGWLPDLNRFLTKVSQLLKVGGHLFIYEQHPFTEMLSTDDDGSADPLKISAPYFKTEPYEETNGIDYVGKTTYESKPMYWFVWTISDILNGIIDSGLRLHFLQEYEKDISASHQRNEQAGTKIPLSYILVAIKSGEFDSP